MDIQKHYYHVPIAYNQEMESLKVSGNSGVTDGHKERVMIETIAICLASRGQIAHTVGSGGVFLDHGTYIFTL